jgi:hypothetical protein
MHKYRRLRGEVLAIRPTARVGGCQVRGTLTFHGTTKAVEGEVVFEVRDGGRRLEIRGERIFDVRDYRLQPPRLLLLRVQPQVTVRATVTAERDDEGGAPAG